MEVDALGAVLREHYGVSDPALQQLPSSWEGNTFHQSRSGSAGWVVRVVGYDRAVGDAQVLSFLEQVGYPAPRLVRTLEGGVMALCGSQAVVITSYIEGASAELWPRTLHDLGRRLGHLHSFSVSATPGLPPAGMLPASDMATALSWLRPLGPIASPALEEIYQQLVAAIRRIDPGEDLPRTLIHNDAHPGNAVITRNGTPMFIDWSGAGLGPPMVDLGFLLISSEVAISWATPIPPADDRVEAIVDGYASHRMPTPVELGWLPDAMRFRGLLYGAGHLADMVAQKRDEVTETWWWERYMAADALANRVRQRFEQHAMRAAPVDEPRDPVT